MKAAQCAIGLVLTIGLVLPALSVGAGSAEAKGFFERAVCTAPGHQHVRCLAHVVTDDRGIPLSASAPVNSGYGPVQFHTAYNLPCSVGGRTAQSICSTPSHFGGQTIGIVDANGDPNIQSDLNTYDSAFRLPPCTARNGCLKVVNEYGQTSPLPAGDAGWALEISLDVEIAHATCQTCKILLVEAGDNLLTAEKTAASMGATEISNSYTWGERSDAASLDPSYDHPGVAVVAATGDSGYGPEYPADSPYVVAAGGTTLTLGSSNSYGSETVWSGAGSGCSLYESANLWQTRMSSWGQTGCGTSRATADVSADADPGTGAAIYDSYGYGGWVQVGGTSLASPLIAGVFALAGGVGSGVNAQSVPYARFTAANSHDVTSGSNGSCTTIICNALPGYDGPTGLGTPNGTGGF